MARVGLGFCVLKCWLRVNIKFPCVSASKADLNSLWLCDHCCSCCFYANNETKLKTGSHFNNNEGDLRKKNQVLMKITMLSGEHQTPVQLSWKFVFTWELNWFNLMISNHHCLVSVQQRPCDWTSFQRTVLWTQKRYKPHSRSPSALSPLVLNGLSGLNSRVGEVQGGLLASL